MYVYYHYNLSHCLAIELHDKIVIKITGGAAVSPLFQGRGLPLEGQQSCRPDTLVKVVVSDLLQVAPEGGQEAPQMTEVAVLRVLHLHEAPGVLTAPDPLTPHLHHGVGTTHREGETLPELSQLDFGLLLLAATIRQLVGPDARRMKLFQDPRLQFNGLLLGQRVRLGDDRHEVGLVGQLPHHRNIELLEAPSVRRYEVEHAVDSGVDSCPALVLLVQIPAYFNINEEFIRNLSSLTSPTADQYNP